jgi:GntR family negative regulator for fad regulon and positive regulator of fabA
MQTELLRPAEYAEKTLLEDILSGRMPVGDNLPAERELAVRLGVARPALREALQRLARDGWVAIQHGKPTRITDYWREGGLNVLSSLVRHSAELPPDFITNLLDVRLALAPSYTSAAVHRAAEAVITALTEAPGPEANPAVFAAFDWHLHYALTVASANPIYTLILNGFAGFYEEMAARYFTNPAARQASGEFYTRLRQAALHGDATLAEQVARQAMQQAQELWGESA